MPCRRPGRERFLLLERAVALQGAAGSLGPGSSGSKEVDALVAKLGEVLQLSAPAPPRVLPKHHGRDRAAPYSSPRGLGFVAAAASLPVHRPRSSPSLLLLPPPAVPPSSLPAALDYQTKGSSPRVAKQLCGRGWLRSAAARSGRKKHPPHQHPLLSAGDDDEEDDNPHRLLQQLILSGNLIKEAVRRLHLAATAAAAASSTATAETSSTTGSPGSASSPGSCCHSSGGEGDSAPPFAVPSLQPLP